MLACGDARKNRDEYIKRLDTMTARYPIFRRMGSAALDLAYVAAGRYDGFWEYDLSPWDVAAGAIIVREAGGFITDTEGLANPVYGKGVLATNGAFHDELVKLLE
jgi:myo-inositol-1(or 4)-monophosphatase